MPIYEYYCPNCNAEYEVIRPVAKADEPAPCRECGKPGQRQLTTFSFKSSTFSAPRLGLPTQRPLRSYRRQPQANPPVDTDRPGQAAL
jgi:putative FmdB family regulatory protein